MLIRYPTHRVLAIGTVVLALSCGGKDQTTGPSFATLAVTTTSLPNAAPTVAYSQTLMATGGDGSYTWSLTVGSLPTGLSLNASTGLISGTPTGASSTFTVQNASGDGQTDTQELTITVNVTLAVTTTSLSSGAQTVAYSETLTATGGDANYTWSVTVGSLPTGLSLNGSNGQISGTPTVLETWDFTAGVVSGDGQRATHALSITVSPLVLVSKIAFTSDRDGNAEIYVMDTDGSNPVNLTNHAAPDVRPTWSPDGSKIAFESNRDGNIEIYVMDTDGSNQVRLTDSAGRDGAPSWSPDGTKIAFESDRDGNIEIYVMDTDGSNPINLTNNADVDGAPAWSPDGTKIAFHSRGEIYVMDADGSNEVRLTDSAGGDGVPSWSPDGSKIAFHSDRDLPGNAEIYVMDADGSNPMRLTDNRRPDSFPVWSPDGTKIAFDSLRDGINGEIYVMDADGSNQVRLTDNAVQDLLPAWALVPEVLLPSGVTR